MNTLELMAKANTGGGDDLWNAMDPDLKKSLCDDMRKSLAAIPITDEAVIVVQRAIAGVAGQCSERAARASIVAFLTEIQKEK